MKRERYVDTSVLKAVATILFQEARNICEGCKTDAVLNMGEDHGLGPSGPNMGMGQSTCEAKKLRKLTKDLYKIIDDYEKANDKEREFWKPKAVGHGG